MMVRWCVFFALFCWTITNCEKITENKDQLEIRPISGDDVNQTDKDVYTAINEANATVTNLENEENFYLLKSKLDIYNPVRLGNYLKNNASGISDSCAQDMITYLEGLKDGKTWAVKSKYKN